MPPRRLDSEHDSEREDSRRSGALPCKAPNSIASADALRSPSKTKKRVATPAALAPASPELPLASSGSVRQAGGTS